MSSENVGSELDDTIQAEQSQGPTQDQLRTVAQLSRQQREIEQEIETLEGQLKDKKSQLNQIRMVDLPEAVQSAGLSSVTLDDGSTVTIEEGVEAHVAKKNVDAAVAWLDEHGYGDIVKRQVAVNAGRDDSLAEQARETLQQMGLDAEIRTELHPQTVKAFVRERYREGEDLPPEDTFGVYHYKKAKVVPSK